MTSLTPFMTCPQITVVVANIYLDIKVKLAGYGDESFVTKR